MIVHNQQEVALALEKAKAEILEATTEAVAAGAEVIAEDARQAAPVRTGTLRDSITVKAAGEVARVEAKAPYARFVQYGTRYMAPEAFLGDVPTMAITEAMSRVYRSKIR